MNKREILNEYIQELKNENPVGSRVENNKNSGYRIWILHRGEELFYQEGNRAIICGIQVRDPQFIYSATISYWDDNSEITAEEKKIIVDRILLYFQTYQNGNPTIV